LKKNKQKMSNNNNNNDPSKTLTQKISQWLVNLLIIFKTTLTQLLIFNRSYKV